MFEGRIVVTGGCTHDDDLNAVEAYDHVTDTWSPMPGMIERRRRHKMVARKNKFFVFLGYDTTNCEVYDSACGEFVLLKLPSIEIFNGFADTICDVVAVGNRLVIFGAAKEEILFYDVENDAWSVEECDALRERGDYRCAKLIQL